MFETILAVINGVVGSRRKYANFRLIYSCSLKSVPGRVAVLEFVACSEAMDKASQFLSSLIFSALQFIGENSQHHLLSDKRLGNLLELHNCSLNRKPSCSVWQEKLIMIEAI